MKEEVQKLILDQRYENNEVLEQSFEESYEEESFEEEADQKKDQIENSEHFYYEEKKESEQ